MVNNHIPWNHHIFFRNKKIYFIKKTFYVECLLWSILAGVYISNKILIIRFIYYNITIYYILYSNRLLPMRNRILFNILNTY